MASVDHLVDRFVAVINSGYRELKPPREVAESLRVAELDGYFDWHIKPADNGALLEELQSLVGLELPDSYRSLVGRYSFPAFELGPLVLYASTREGACYELLGELGREDPALQVLLSNRMIPFARPVDLHLDPVCFDTRNSGADGEPPVVRIGYETAIGSGRVEVVSRVASSFRGLLELLLCAGPGEA